MLICRIDEFSYWTGEFADVAEEHGAQPGWVIADPPELGENEFAVWLGDWVKTPDNRPIMRLESANSEFRKRRSDLLSETDWWAIRAAETGEPMSDDKLAYRNALRTMDDAADFDPFNPIWPEKP